MEPETCRGCGLTHKRVECAGIYHCPNPACMSSGAAIHRMKLTSYQQNASGTHTVDPQEVIDTARAHLWNESDQAIKAAIEKMLPRWLALIPSTETNTP